MEYMQLDKKHHKMALLEEDSMLDRVKFILNHPDVTTLPKGADSSSLPTELKIKIHDLSNMVGNANKFKKTEVGESSPWYNPLPVKTKRTCVKPIPFSMLRDYAPRAEEESPAVAPRNPARSSTSSAVNEEFVDTLPTPKRRTRGGFTPQEEQFILMAVYGKVHKNGDRDWATAFRALGKYLPGHQITLQQMKDKFNNLKKKDPMWEDKVGQVLASTTTARTSEPSVQVNPNSTGRFALAPTIGVKRRMPAKESDSDTESDDEESEEDEVVYAESDSGEEEEDDDDSDLESNASLLMTAAVRTL